MRLSRAFHYAGTVWLSGTRVPEVPEMIVRCLPRCLPPKSPNKTTSPEAWVEVRGPSHAAVTLERSSSRYARPVTAAGYTLFRRWPEVSAQISRANSTAVALGSEGSGREWPVGANPHA